MNSDGELVEYNKDKDPEMMKAVQVGIHIISVMTAWFTEFKPYAIGCSR